MLHVDASQLNLGRYCFLTWLVATSHSNCPWKDARYLNVTVLCGTTKLCTGLFCQSACWKQIAETLYNAMQWINWIGGRWRTQLNAWHNVNCRTHEHWHFERILQVCACNGPTLGSGSAFNIHQGFEPCSVWPPAGAGSSCAAVVRRSPTLGSTKPGLDCGVSGRCRACQRAYPIFTFDLISREATRRI